MLGFELDVWDYVTFATLAVVLVGLVAGLAVLAALPGRIAIARNHPDAEAVRVMGWAGFLAIVPWIQAFIWAFKPTNIVDIRRLPPEEREEVARMIARLSGAKSDSGTSDPSE